MFLHILLNLCAFGRYFKSPVLELTESNFSEIVDKRSNSSVIFVCFHAGMGPVRQSSLPGFNIAAKKLEGMVTFGAVDISKYRDVTPRFQINTLPSYRIFHSHGVAHYLNLYRNESAFIKASKAYLPNYSETPDASWISNGESAAILFVDSGEIPIYWLSIGCNFHDSNDSNDSRIHIGFTNETSAFKQFHIARNETVLLSKNGSTKQIPGNVPFKELLTSIRSYFKEEEQEKEL